jgi:acyl dehydratase
LQVRNRLTLHSPLRAGEGLTLTGWVAAWRVVENGLEVDLQTRLGQNGTCAWESVVTFRYRGKFGPPAEHGTAHGAAPLAPTVDEQSMKSEPWRIHGDDRWAFGALTGDYNGLHQWDWYARKFGFSRRVRASAACYCTVPGTASGTGCRQAAARRVDQRSSLLRGRGRAAPVHAADRWRIRLRALRRRGHAASAIRKLDKRTGRLMRIATTDSVLPCGNDR